MIQRVQSVYLLVGIILSVAIFVSGIFVVTDGVDAVFIGALGVQDGALVIDFVTPIPIMILAGMLVVMQGYAIASFKNRKLQATIVNVSIYLTVLMIGWIGYMYYDLMALELRINPLSGAIHPFLIIFADILALRGIKKDSALVKSVDRLR